MRIWLFYKTLPGEGGTKVEFRRVENGNVSNFLPEKLRGTVTIPSGTDTDKAVQALVRQSGWVLGNARPVGDEIAKVVLQGRW